MQQISLIALDLDGTLFNSKLQISQGNRQMIQRALQAGVEVVISTGRPYCTIPVELLMDMGIRYAITANGAAVYELGTRRCLYEDAIPLEDFMPIARKLATHDILFHVFAGGYCYSQTNQYAIIAKMKVDEAYRNFLLSASDAKDDIVAFLQDLNTPVQKGSVTFYTLDDGTCKDADQVLPYLKEHPLLTSANGGGNNLEFTRAGVSKAKGLRFLAGHLGIHMAHTMAIGDSENDLDIITAAGMGVAMANAAPVVKHSADYITLTNDEDGVAHAINHFLHLV